MKNNWVLAALLLVPFFSPAQQSTEYGYQLSFSDSTTASGSVEGIVLIGNEYATAGYQNYGAQNFMLSKLDSVGNWLWSKTYGGTVGDFAVSIDTTQFNGLVMAGWGKSFGAGDDDIMVVKTDEDGIPLFTKTYGTPTIDRASCIKSTSDSGLVVAGFTNGFGAGVNDILIIKTTFQGDTAWARTYGSAGNDNGSWAQETSNGIIVCGNTGVGPSFLNMYMMLLNNSGDTIWCKSYGTTGGITSAYCVRPVSYGGFITTGFTAGGGLGGNDLFALKTDAFGNIEWVKSYGTSGSDFGFEVIELEDVDRNGTPGFAFSGASEDQAWILVTDTSGNIVWSTISGTSTNTNNFSGITQGYTENFAVVGNGSFKANPGDDEYLLVKASYDISPFNLCNGNPASVQDSTVPGFVAGAFEPIIGTPTLTMTSQNLTDSLRQMQDTSFCFETIPVGLSQNEKADFKVYPNPSSGYISIDLSQVDEKVIGLEILDVLGKRVFEKSFDNHNSQLHLDLTFLNHGPYLLKLTTENQKIARRFLLLNE